jgi:hypothetical protein
MAALATTGLTKYYGSMTAVDNHDRAGDEGKTNNDPKDSMVEQR